MSTIILRGTNIVFGVRDPKPVVGAPEGRQRIRMRLKDAARLFVKTADGLRGFYLSDEGDSWSVRSEFGRNFKPWRLA